jgi:hypothetical protein
MRCEVILHIICRFILVLKGGGLGVNPCDICTERSATGIFISECFHFTLSVSFSNAPYSSAIQYYFCQNGKRTTKQHYQEYRGPLDTNILSRCSSFFVRLRSVELNRLKQTLTISSYGMLGHVDWQIVALILQYPHL